MNLNLSPARLLLFAALIAALAFLGGFSPPKVLQQGYHSSHRVTRAWFYCVAAFVIGAGCMALVDHYVGTMEPTNLRPAYMLLGALLITGSLLALRTIKEATAPPKEAASLPVQSRAVP